MKKRVLTIILVVATGISVFALLYPERQRVPKGSVQVNNEIKIDNEYIVDKEEIVEQEVIEEMHEEKEIKKDVTIRNDSKSTEVVKKKEEKKEEKKVVDELEEEESLTAAMVFKVDTNKIESKLSIANKAKLVYYTSKLSNFDYSRITEILKSKITVESAKDITKILMSRLDKDDYKKVKEILEPYINMEKIEEHISV